jgi:pimeloyl-ACP methyl ester carboxylesterase
VAALYFTDMKSAHSRVSAKGIVIDSPYGRIEYTRGGTGPDVLVIHGSGGGYDQGELIAQAVLGDEFHWITPSRFGYLRSSVRQGATWEDQAHAYAQLLDSMGIEKVAVVAMSQGGPSALFFALLHSERVSSLTLISCGVVSSSMPGQAQANQRGDVLTTIFEHDLYYWVISKVFRRQLMGLMGVDESVAGRLTPQQRALFASFIDDMNPVSLRSAGAVFDNQATLPGKSIAAIVAPTLIFHAADDTLQLYHNAEFAAATIPDATLVHFEKGGHFIIGIEQQTIREALKNHILNNIDAASR